LGSWGSMNKIAILINVKYQISYFASVECIIKLDVYRFPS